MMRKRFITEMTIQWPGDLPPGDVVTFSGDWRTGARQGALIEIYHNDGQVKYYLPTDESLARAIRSVRALNERRTAPPTPVEPWPLNV